MGTGTVLAALVGGLGAAFLATGDAAGLGVGDATRLDNWTLSSGFSSGFASGVEGSGIASISACSATDISSIGRNSDRHQDEDESCDRLGKLSRLDIKR